LLLLAYIILAILGLYFTINYMIKIINGFCCYTPATQPKSLYHTITKPPRASSYYASLIYNPMMVAIEWFSKEIYGLLRIIEEECNVKIDLLRQLSIFMKLRTFISLTLNLSKYLGIINAIRLSLLLFKLRSIYINMHIVEREIYSKDLYEQYRKTDEILAKVIKYLDMANNIISKLQHGNSNR